MCILCTMAERKTRLKEQGKKPTATDLILTEKEYRYANRLLEAEKAGLSLAQYMKGRQRWGSLHGHSDGSQLDGGASVEAILKKAKMMGQDFVAITDHGNMFNAVKAHKIAKDLGIKHIVGCELYITPVGKSMDDKTFAKGEKAYHHLVVWAKNKIGYSNLCKLSSMGYERGFYRAPRIDREVLKAHSEGLIVTTSCVGGSVPMNAYEGEFYKAESDLEFYMKTFGADFYVELQSHGTEIEESAFEYMRTMAQKYNLPTLITTDSHYLDEEDQTTHDSLICIGTGQFVDQADRKFKFEGTGFHYHSQEEVEALFPHDREAIYRAGEIADKIEDQVIDFGDIKLPPFEVPVSEDFASWCMRGEANKWI